MKYLTVRRPPTEKKLPTQNSVKFLSVHFIYAVFKTTWITKSVFVPFPVKDLSGLLQETNVDGRKQSPDQ